MIMLAAIKIISILAALLGFIQIISIHYSFSKLDIILAVLANSQDKNLFKAALK
jgi:hypothetical protein